ncbi:MAG: CubicO group peptidase (beta-lactamase class C family) [Chlamydiales bacterium]
MLRPLPNRSRRYSYYHPWTYAESEELYFVPVWDYSFNSGGGNLVSTADELAKFGESLAELESLTLDDFELLLGWSSELDSRGRRRLFVSGSNPGVQAALAVYPEDGLAVAVLANTWGVGSRSGEMVRLASSVAETLFEGS